MILESRDTADEVILTGIAGTLVLAVLATLREEHYGYSLRKGLAAAGVDIEEGTLYPLIRRLEGYRLLGDVK